MKNPEKFEILYGTPHNVDLTGIHVVGEKALTNYLLSLSKILRLLHKCLLFRTPVAIKLPIQSFKHGDQDYLKTWKDTPLAEKWKGPYQVLLTTHRTMKLKALDS